MPRLSIAKEMKLPERVVALVDGVSFSNYEAIRDSDWYEQKIVCYADSRVGPRGILSLSERQEEAWRRYSNRQHPEMPRSRARFDELAAAAHEVEKQIFSHCSIKSEDIDDASAAPLVEELRKYPVGGYLLSVRRSKPM